MRSAHASLSRLVVATTLMTTSGCGIVEANIQAIDTLGRSSASDGEKAFAGAVVGGTLAVLTGLAVAVTLTTNAATSGDPVPPEEVVVDELGWGLRRDGGDVRWYRCTSRLLCTHQEITEPTEAVLAVEPAGRGQPLAHEGFPGGEVDLVRVRVRRRR